MIKSPRHHSSLGKKFLMAISGLLLVGFAIAHLWGNLHIFEGPDALNAYASGLRALGPLLWLVRAVLLAAFLIHVVTSVQLKLENRRARPHGYRHHRTVRTTIMAKTMMASGILLLVYLVYHLLHFTFRVTNPEISHGSDALGRRDVYMMVVRSFRQWPIVFAYVLGMGGVCFHLSHGIGSVFQTLGLVDERSRPVVLRIGQWFAFALFLGYASIPVGVLWGFVK